MSPIYVPGKVVLAKNYVGIDDPDAAAYITAVETADGQSLETAVKVAIHSFVKGCKADGIWSAIKASCILAGARTLNGALIPLAGTAPNRFGTEGGWNYNRKTGLQGNGTDNYLNSNRNSNSDPQNNVHAACYASVVGTNVDNKSYIGASTAGSNILLINTAAVAGRLVTRFNSSVSLTTNSVNVPGLIGASRNNADTYVLRANLTNNTLSATSVAPASSAVGIFGRIDGANTIAARLAFYSIGESLDLALLDARVTDLINAFGVAIP